jgi:hypothetical protein
MHKNGNSPSEVQLIAEINQVTLLLYWAFGGNPFQEEETDTPKDFVIYLNGLAICS